MLQWSCEECGHAVHVAQSDPEVNIREPVSETGSKALDEAAGDDDLEPGSSEFELEGGGDDRF
jgi:hypothetical protein